MNDAFTMPFNNPKVPIIPPIPAIENQRPFWSVIIPVYNPNKDYLTQTLRSVLVQDPGSEQMQIEVVDDCSPDVNVPILVREIIGERVKVFKTHKNLGLAGCWNKCIQRAYGVWVHILHQDDLILPSFYSTIQHLIVSHPSAGAAFCNYDLINSSGATIYKPATLQTLPGPIEHPEEILAVQNQVQCPAIVVKRSAYEKVGGYDSRFTFTLDWEMWIRIASSFPILYHPKPLASFRMQADSETSRLERTGETVRDSMRMIDGFPNYISADRVKEIQSKARLWVCDLAIMKANRFFEKGELTHALAQFHACLRYDHRWSSWRIALGCWRRAVRKSKKFIFPPFPILPASCFQTKN